MQAIGVAELVRPQLLTNCGRWSSVIHAVAADPCASQAKKRAFCGVLVDKYKPKSTSIWRVWALRMLISGQASPKSAITAVVSSSLSRCATCTSNRSPWECPSASLRVLKLSRSANSKALLRGWRVLMGRETNRAGWLRGNFNPVATAPFDAVHGSISTLQEFIHVGGVFGEH